MCARMHTHKHTHIFYLENSYFKSRLVLLSLGICLWNTIQQLSLSYQTEFPILEL